MARTTPRPLTVALLVLGLVLGALLSGCTVSEPDAGAWKDQARQTLDDVASEVATARLVIGQLDEGRLPSSYGVVMLADAEEAASAAEESLSSVQPPAALGGLPDRVLALIGRATDAVQAAREAVVAGQYDVAKLRSTLRRLHQALDRRRAAL